MRVGRRVALALFAAIVVSSIAPSGSAAVLPAPGVVTGGLLNRCEVWSYTPPPWSSANASFKFTGRIIHNGATLTVTRGHATLDIGCGSHHFINDNANLVMTVNTPSGMATIECSGDYAEAFGLLAGVAVPLPGLTADFTGYCDPAAPIGKRPYIRVQLILLGPDRDPSPTEEAFTIVGAYVMDGCGRPICIRRSEVFPPLAD